YSSSWSYTGISHYIGGQDGYPSDLFWDGVNWWVSGIYSDATHKYNSDWSYTGISYDTSGQDDYPTDIFWDGVNWWMLGYGNSRVFAYGDLNNEFENTLPGQNPFLIYIIVGLSSGILGISLLFIYVLKMKKKKTQTLVREIIDNKKIFCPICYTELKQGEKKCLNCENASKENKMREKLIRKKQKSAIQRNKKGKRRDLRKFKNMMLRETIGAFLAPFLIPLLLLTYDFPTEVNIIFIVVVSIVSPLVGLLFLRAYLKANSKYKESLSQVSSYFRTKQIHSNSYKKEEIPISEVRQDFNSSGPINEVSKLKTEEFQLNSSISNKEDKELRVNSYTCKTCGKQLIKKASYCPYCGK
ncbi:MAG: zinc ribbon domain-containing protein, partial [Candidatus Lokiarchaeota archaeon]|nr:zinc ribbon domain-containing protein [Candidatus Lokiarchaeota archaeon]